MSRIPRKLVLSLCLFTLAACAPDAADDEMEMEEAAEAEMPAEAAMEEASPMAQWAGTWEGVAILESGDTVPTTMVATDSRDGWTITLPDRDPMPLRVVSAEGDSLVLEMGPYESILREGVQVSVRQVIRMQGDAFTGTLVATYEGGEGASEVAGDVEGSRTN